MARRPVFLAPAAYRQRRWRDAARLLPVAGAVLLAVPLLWGDDPPSGSRAVLYVFAVWALLIVAAAVIGRAVDPADAAPPEDDPGRGPGAP